MERRGLNIRKGFLKAVLPMIRALPLAGGVAVRLGHRPDGIPAGATSLRDSFRRGGLPRPIRPRLPVGRPVGEPRAGGQPRPVANAGPAARRRSRPARPRDVHRDRARTPGRRLRRWGAAASCWPTTSARISCRRTGCFARAFPVRFYMERPRHISRYMSRHFETERPARTGQAVHLAPGRAGRLGQLDPPCSPDDQGRHAALPGRRCPLDRAAHRVGSVPGPRRCDSRRPGSSWPR